MPFCNDYVNRFIDILRGQSFSVPTTLNFALVPGKGKWAASTAYALNDLVVPSTDNRRIYKCTTAGTSSGSEPSWTTTNGATVSDGTVVWTEQSTALNAGTFAEAAGGGYSRASKAASLAELSGTQGVGTTAASSGATGKSSNNTAIKWGPFTADTGVMIGVVVIDNLSRNVCWTTFASPKQAGLGVEVQFDPDKFSVEMLAG
jgi:hypothetical protein